MKKISWLAGLLLLTACYRSAPTPVPFPDDPRVLHGEWSLEVLSRNSAADFQFDVDGTHLMIRLGDGSSYRYLREPEGWTEVVRGLPAGQYDPELDAFVTLHRQGSAVRLQIVDLAGQSSAQVVELTQGFGHQRLLVASGRLFSISGAEAHGAVVHWWNLRDVADQGSRSLPSQRHGVGVSVNGRIISFWDLNMSRTHLLDTVRPEVPLSVPLGVFCRAAGLGEASHDGRWFVLWGCNSSAIVYDLHDPGSAGRGLGVQAPDGAVFASDVAELLWSDSSGAIHSVDVLTGTKQTLHGTMPENREHQIRQWQWVAPYLHRASGTLAFSTEHGYVQVTDLRAGIDQSLPPYTLTDARLMLQATPPDVAAPWSWYTVSGMWLGGDNNYEVHGSVSAWDMHVYQPSSLSPSMGPPPEVSAHLSMHEHGTDVDSERLTLTLTNRDRSATEFHGQLDLLQGGATYTVRLFREGR